MSPLIPEIHDELLAAAERRSRRRHWWVRPRRAAALAIAGAIVVAGGAVAAGTGVFDAGTGETGEGTYTVRAITDGDGGVCLAVQMSVPKRPDGTPVTCDPRPLSQPLTAHFGYVSGERRLLAVSSLMRSTACASSPAIPISSYTAYRARPAATSTSRWVPRVPS